VGIKGKAKRPKGIGGVLSQDFTGDTDCVYMMNSAHGLEGISLVWWPTLLRSMSEREVKDQPYETLTADLQELFGLAGSVDSDA
jgi:hypothetical protein